MLNRKGNIEIGVFGIIVICVFIYCILTETPLLDKMFPTKEKELYYKAKVDSLTLELKYKEDSLRVQNAK